MIHDQRHGHSYKRTALVENDSQPVHSSGFPSLGPPTLCGEAGPAPEPCGEVTCPTCNDLLCNPEKLTARLEELLEAASQNRTPRTQQDIDSERTARERLIVAIRAITSADATVDGPMVVELARAAKSFFGEE
jgi:hypothetical protein